MNETQDSVTRPGNASRDRSAPRTPTNEPGTGAGTVLERSLHGNLAWLCGGMDSDSSDGREGTLLFIDDGLGIGDDGGGKLLLEILLSSG